MIKIVKLDKYFNRFKRNQVHVINKTSLEFDSKGLVSLLGPSGCGKTTLLNVIGGLDKANRGKVYINGKKLGKHFNNRIDKIRNLNIGYIFQDYNLIEDQTVFQNVEISLKTIGVKDAKERKRRVDYVLNRLGLYRYRTRLVTMLSGGERQRVGIARAIVKNPSIIIADEPTGNLDSKNTLEIMNIIKEISKEKLVILVTHEKELAYFYADRIIELKDGSVEKDYLNDHQNELDYRIDQKIYLQDMPTKKSIAFGDVNVKYFSDSDQPVDLTIVVRKGNVYLQTNDKRKAESVNKNSVIELVNDHYHAITKNDNNDNPFDMESVVQKKYKLRYKSIFNIFTLILFGFKKVFNYTLAKKLLLIGFVVSGMFITYSFSNIAGVNDFDDSEFTSKNQEYINLEVPEMDPADYNDYIETGMFKYILPGNSIVAFKVVLNDFYQLNDNYILLEGSLASTELITADQLIHGTMPEDNRGLVIDVKAIENFDMYGMGTQFGLYNDERFIGQELSLDKIPGTFTITGVVDTGSPSIYAAEDMLIPIVINSMNQDMMYNGGIDQQGVDFRDYTFYPNISVKKGRLPKNSYEVMVHYDYREDMKLNSHIDVRVNGRKLKVVGYYSSSTAKDRYYISSNTAKYNLVAESREFSVIGEDKATTLEFFLGSGFNAVDSYSQAKEKFLKQQEGKINSGLIFAGITMAISLIEILLIIRASFLSRIKEVGVYRAIGLKKKEIYKMFLGEIFAITIIASIPGCLFMYYTLSGVVNVPFIGEDFLVNWTILAASLTTIVFFNVVFGLLPVYGVMRKKPAAILSRTDI